jgi:hypothetical protein
MSARSTASTPCRPRCPRPASCASTSNRYSVDARAVGRPVEIRAYAERVECWQDGAVVGEHDRAFGRGKAIYDPLALHPGARPASPARCATARRSRTGTLPPAMRACSASWNVQPGGDRQMVDILGAVLTDGLDAVEAACAEALSDGVHSPTSSSTSSPAAANRRRPDRHDAGCAAPALRARRRLRPLRQPQETRRWSDRRCWTRWAS